MKTIKFWVNIFAMFALFAGCSFNHESQDFVPSTETTKVDSSENQLDVFSFADENLTITEYQLEGIQSFSGTLEELLKEYPATFVIKNDWSYRVTYYGDETVALVCFDLNGENPVCVTFCSIMSKVVFENIKIGDALETVHALDPNGYYICLEGSGAPAPRVSMHYTSDKYCITISYDEGYAVSDISIEKIQSGVV